MFRPVQGLARAVSVLVWSAGVAGVLVVLLVLAVTDAALEGRVEQSTLGFLLLGLLGYLALYGVLYLAAGAVVIVWTWRARANVAEGHHPHRYSRAWTIWGWLLPVASLWIPRCVMADIWRAAAPDDTTRADLRLVDWWWTTLIGSAVIGCAGPLLVTPGDDPIIVLAWCVPSALLALISAALLSLVVERVSNWLAVTADAVVR